MRLIILTFLVRTITTRTLLDGTLTVTLIPTLKPALALSGFVPFFEQKLQGLYKDFQGHISHFSRTPFSAKKRFESMSFLVLPQHEQFYPEGLSY